MRGRNREFCGNMSSRGFYDVSTARGRLSHNVKNCSNILYQKRPWIISEPFHAREKEEMDTL